MPDDATAGDQAVQSVQVALRVRPMNERETAAGTVPVVTASNGKKEVTLIRGAGQRQQRQTYHFDSVFTSFSTQHEVFETIRPLVKEVMQGFEATVFAYGQTGTGKTHTMEGDISSDDMKGIIPRAVEAIFESLGDSKYVESTVVASYLEIYNEDLSDLLLETHEEKKSAYHGSSKVDGHETPRLQLVEDKGVGKTGGKGVFVKNLSEHVVKNKEDVLALLSRAQERRRVGETRMNKRSSRSHCVFTLKVQSQSPTEDGCMSMQCSGKLHLVDLAGSECAKTAGDGVNDARERERKNINQSLLTLGRVISALREGEKGHTSRIPYRDSKLTRLLQESLGGRCKTVIVATLSPSILAVDESFSTLNYAQQAQGITNKPVATSYLKVIAGGIPAIASKDGEETEATGAESWGEVMSKLAYYKNQAEEAQSALARKHMQQAEIVARADAAEEAKRVLDVALEAQKAETTQLAGELDAKKIELQATHYVLSVRRDTETRLGEQAKKLLSTLEASDADAAAIHLTLTRAAQQAQEQLSRRDAFNGEAGALLENAASSLLHLDATLSKQRDAVLTAAEAYDRAVEAEVVRMGEAAAGFVCQGDEQLRRAKSTLDEVQASAVAALEGKTAEAKVLTQSMAERSKQANEDVATELQNVETKLSTSEGDVLEWARTSHSRHKCAAAQLAESHQGLAKALETAAQAAQARLADGQTRLNQQREALSALLSTVEEGRAFETKLKATLEELHSAGSAAHTERSARLQKSVEALRVASEAQHAGQSDEALLAAVGRATQALKASTSDAHAALDQQRKVLGEAGEQQRVANASKAICEQVSEANAIVESSTATRTSELEEQQRVLTLQRGELAALAENQEELRHQLLNETMSAVQSLLGEKLGHLAAALSAGVQQATTRSEGVSTLATTSIENHATCLTAYVQVSEKLTTRTNAWGKACEQVGDVVTQASEAAAAVQNDLRNGEDMTSKEHTEVASQAHAWARSDADCRAALATVKQQQQDALATEGESAAAQNESYDRLRALTQEVSGRSASATECIGKAAVHNDESGQQLQSAAQKGNDETATQLTDLGALGTMQAAAIATESDSLDKMLAQRPEVVEAMHEHVRKARKLCSETADAHSEQSAAHVSLCDGTLEAQRMQWQQLQEQSEATATAAAAAFRATKADADSVSNRHAKQLEEAKLAREALSASHAAEAASFVEKHNELLSGSQSALKHFVGSSAEVTPVTAAERTQHSFDELLESCPDEEVLRAHFMEHGNEIPFTVAAAPPAVPPVLPVSSSCSESSAPAEIQLPLLSPRVDNGVSLRAKKAVGGGVLQAVAAVGRFKRMAEQDLKGMAATELKKMLEDAKLPTEGRREDMISRLQRAASMQPASKIPKTPGRRTRSDPYDKAEWDGKSEEAGRVESKEDSKASNRSKQPGARATRTGQVLKELNEN